VLDGIKPRVNRVIALNLSDNQWQVRKNVLNSKERQQKYDFDEIINNLFTPVKWLANATCFHTVSHHGRRLNVDILERKKLPEESDSFILRVEYIL
jgi:hypothetical protein